MWESEPQSKSETTLGSALFNSFTNVIEEGKQSSFCFESVKLVWKYSRLLQVKELDM